MRFSNHLLIYYSKPDNTILQQSIVFYYRIKLHLVPNESFIILQSVI